MNAHQLGSTRSTVLRSGCDALVELFETSDVQVGWSYMDAGGCGPKEARCLVWDTCS